MLAREEPKPHSRRKDGGLVRLAATAKAWVGCRISADTKGTVKPLPIVLVSRALLPR